MEQLTPEGLRVVNELAQHYGFSQEAVIQMMFAMVRGQGAMAQFNHPEFGGSGQWMRNGMLMLGDMFNQALKARVEGLCQAIAAQLASQPQLFPSGSFQSQSQSGGAQQMQVSGAAGMPMGMIPLTPMPPLAETGHSLFTPDPRDTWWPRELGTPSAIGAQNDVRYALFPSIGRLAIETNGRVTVYDTGGHQIAGFSQQQGPGGAMVFSTPNGSVSLTNLSSMGAGAEQQSQSSAGGGFHQQAQRSSGGGVHQQAQSSGGGSQQQQQVSTGFSPMPGLAPMAGMAPMTFAPLAPSEAWWPPELGSPSSTGAQNNLRYAVFPAARRLALDVNGRVSVHDCGDLQISGCSQASGDAEVCFITNSGTISLSSLPEVWPTPSAAATPPHASAESPAPGAAVASPAATGEATHDTQQAAVLDALTKLGELKTLGILTEEEFAAKKAELLRRL